MTTPSQLGMFDEEVAPPKAKPLAELQAGIRAGRDLAKAGAQRALGGAQAADPEFASKALRFFVQFAKEAGRPVQCTEARNASVGIVPVPKEPRAWGQIPLKAARLGCVVKGPLGPSVDPVQHSNPAWSWRWIKDIE